MKYVSQQLISFLNFKSQENVILEMNDDHSSSKSSFPIPICICSLYLKHYNVETTKWYCTADLHLYFTWHQVEIGKEKSLYERKILILM